MSVVRWIHIEEEMGVSQLCVHDFKTISCASPRLALCQHTVKCHDVLKE